MALLLEAKTLKVISRILLFLKPYLGWSLVTQISQMTQISSLLFISPTDFTEFHRFLPYAGWDFADEA